MTEQIDVLIVGGGQAGLAASYRLAQAGVSHPVVDASAKVGDSWRHRYHSLTLFTPRRLSSLPGLPLYGDPEAYAGRLEFADYLQSYAETNRLPLMSGTRVVRLECDNAGAFVAELGNGATVRSQAVLVCTGGFQQAIIPEVASRFGSNVAQLTVSTYRSPQSIGTGPVLVVGDGASGRDIAVELAATHDVLLATGKPRRLFPQRVLGISTWMLMDRVGLLSVSSRSPIGRIMMATDPFPDRGRSLAALRGQGVNIRSRLVDASDRTAIFADGSRADVASVIWAVGYRNDDSWIEVPAGKPGLQFLGRPWQRNRASALILGADRDSKVVVKNLLQHLDQP
ncbi:flavin-containing monooxygenase [Devosia salina]|uniref:NAD(P)/FAD-dependent oxidoreductase n=1 Tax=Devosia salina TaxID=2860336 RepID=A0ABX8W9N7_9HYPH|nr:NAD(P)/FAD-dependent oxidoreductase [Devosia salina]QYO75593.1 NAD(P)/FAD-dependent oxidoreductase [Devosia salina]